MNDIAVSPARSWSLRILVAFAALNSVAPLLAWVYGVGSFSSWYWRWTFPWLVVLVALTVVAQRRASLAPLHRDITAGALGGLIGTILYDLVRLPFLLMGYRLLAPIDSYGVLILNAAGSSGRTGLMGWLFHTTNGVCFGVAYGVIAACRHPAFAVAWAMGLEAVAVLSPFALRYGLNHRWGLIAIAFGAHVPYGLAIGLACRKPEATLAKANEVVPRPTLVALAVTAIGFVMWQQPWSTSKDARAGERVAPGPSAVIRDKNLSPEWIRVAEHGCAAIRNDDKVPHTFNQRTIAPGETVGMCFDKPGVRRLKVDGAAWSGGFVIVDPEEEP